MRSQPTHTTELSEQKILDAYQTLHGTDRDEWNSTVMLIFPKHREYGSMTGWIKKARSDKYQMLMCFNGSVRTKNIVWRLNVTSIQTGSNVEYKSAQGLPPLAALRALIREWEGQP